MTRENYNDLYAFLMVARERSFTRAAAKLGVSQSALSHIIQGLEARLALCLLTRTTRSVSLTEAGERLLLAIGPRFEDIKAELSALTALRDKPVGTVRITASEYVINAILWPRLKELLPDYPDIKLELIIEYAMTDSVAQRYDAGVRFGGQRVDGMIAVRIGPDTRMAVVGSPAYLAARGRPRAPADLSHHQGINLRLPGSVGLYAWELEKDGYRTAIQVNGQLVFNEVKPVIAACLDGFGLACVPEDIVSGHIEAGRLQRVLEDWCPPRLGYHLYYPHRLQSSSPLRLLVEALRYRE